MTKEINRTIRSLKASLKELNTIALDDYLIIGESTQGNEMYFNEHLNETQHQIDIMLYDLEEKYQKLHKIGAHNDTFSTNDPVENIEIEVSPNMLTFEFYKMKRVHDSRIYVKEYEAICNKMTYESYKIIENGDD